MIIITLVVIGFSQLMQREQRQALDRQLSSQALYAAETAVNDVYNLLLTGRLTDAEKPDCDLSDTALFPTGGVVNPGSNNEAAYTCVTYDLTPTYLEFNNGGITTQQSKIFPIQPVANNPNTYVKSLTFSWSGAGSDKDLNNGLADDCSNTLPVSTGGTGVPILRVDLVRLPTSEAVNRDTAIDSTTTFFLYPTGSCGDDERNYNTLTADIDDKGTIIPVSCDSSQAYACEFTLDNMNNGGPTVASDRYFARVKSIYNDADLRLEGEATASGPAGGSTLEFIGAQVNVDATGKANDVLRRISVQLGNPQVPIPEFVIQGLDGICKGIEIAPPNEAPYSCY